MKPRIFLYVLPALFFALTPSLLIAKEKPAQVSVMYYFTDELGQAGIRSIFKRFSAEQQISVVENPIGHEKFKSAALQMAAEGQLPDVISYWAGARTRFLIDSGSLAPLDNLWQRGRYDSLLPEALVDSATLYNGHRYLVPFGYHAAGFFYNPQVFRAAGISTPPRTWPEFLAVCERLKQNGIKPLALGAKNRWPAQFWFDYLLLRTAGPEFRQQLMNGKASYTDPRVVKVMERWLQLLQKDYFASGLDTDDWNDAADLVAEGDAAMTLMGTWVGGYWGSKNMQSGSDYDFFPFPEIDPAQKRAVVGPVDGMVIAAGGNRVVAEKLVNFLFTDLQVQEGWAKAQGALSPNRQISPSIYNPVMSKVLQEVNTADIFTFSYDLATTPPMAEQGLSMFRQFLENPARFPEYLQETQSAAEQIFGR